MQIITAQPNAGAVSELTIAHGGRTLPWPARAISVKEPFIFRELNEYWEQLPDQRQDEIFACYEKIHQFFQDYFSAAIKVNVGQLIQLLQPYVKELIDLMPLEDVDYWIRRMSKLPIPNKLGRSYNAESAPPGVTKERTYFEDDYRTLLPLAVVVRSVIPIWGEFYNMVKTDISSQVRPQYCFRILRTSALMWCEPMQRLRLFVQHTIPQERNPTAVVRSGVSSEDFPEHILANTVVERLAKTDLMAVTDDIHPVTYLFNYIKQNPAQIENQWGRIYDKHSGERGDDEQNISRMEGFKVKEEISRGDIAATIHQILRAASQVRGEVEVTSQRALVHRMAPGDPAFLDVARQSLNSVQALETERLQESQVMLAHWVMANWISVRSIPHRAKTSVITAIGFAQAYLWHFGYKELAAIVSGIARTDNQNQDFESIAMERLKMDKAQVDEYAYRFPYSHRTGSRAKTAKSMNPAIKSTEQMMQALIEYEWRLTLPDSWISQLPGASRARPYVVPANIRVLLARLVIELDEKATPPLIVGVQ